MDLGIMVEGVVEVDPISGRAMLRVLQEDGTSRFLDMLEQVTPYSGQEVRFIVTPLKNVAELAKLVEAGEIEIPE